MGMDVSGINPTTKRGDYFRANCWSWRPIHELVAEVCREADGPTLSAKQLQMMSFNDGAPGKVSRAALNRIIKGLKEKVSVIKQLGGENAVITGKIPDAVAEMLRSTLKQAGATMVGPENPYQAHVEHIEEFISFLEGCGDGFEVW